MAWLSIGNLSPQQAQCLFVEHKVYVSYLYRNAKCLLGKKTHPAENIWLYVCPEGRGLHFNVRKSLNSSRTSSPFSRHTEPENAVQVYQTEHSHTVWLREDYWDKTNGGKKSVFLVDAIVWWQGEIHFWEIFYWPLLALRTINLIQAGSINPGWLFCVQIGRASCRERV